MTFHILFVVIGVFKLLYDFSYFLCGSRSFKLLYDLSYFLCGNKSFQGTYELSYFLFGSASINYLMSHIFCLFQLELQVTYDLPHFICHSGSFKLALAKASKWEIICGWLDISLKEQLRILVLLSVLIPSLLKGTGMVLDAILTTGMYAYFCRVFSRSRIRVQFMSNGLSLH